MSAKEEDKESKEPDYNEDKDQLEEKTGEINQEPTNQVFWACEKNVLKEYDRLSALTRKKSKEVNAS
jgi:hypothetical protein